MATNVATASTPKRAGIALPSYPWRFAHLAALWAFGVSQPVFSMLKANPEFLVVRGSTRSDVVAYALLLAFVPPLVVVLVEFVVALVWALLARALHILAIWSFGYLAALQLVRMLEPENGAALLLPMLPALLLAFAYMRWEGFRSILSISFLLPAAGTLFFVATVPLAVGDGARPNVEVRSKTPVVLVVLDEFPVSSLMRADGSIDEKRYPNFARLARAGVWYPRATTVHEFTTQAVPALVTGNMPVKDQLPTLTDHPESLFTLLGGRYAFEVAEPVTRLCPSEFCPEAHVEAPWIDRYRGLLYDTGVAYMYRVLPAALRLELPPIGDRWGGFGEGAGGGTRERLLGALDLQDVNLALEREDHQPRTEFHRFLAGIRRGEPSRTLHFVHLSLPHAPFRLLPSGREYGNATSIDGILDDAFNDWTPSSWLVDQALQRHLLQVGYTDRLIGLLVQRLEQAGIYDRALVIVTADHGASFQAGGSRRYVTAENVADIAGVPLFVKYPGQRHGRVDRRSANTTDIVPTIADVVGVQMPWHVDGRSLLGSPVARRISVGRRDGGARVVSPELVEAGVLATARRNAGLFGEGGDSLYRIGPHPTLIGRKVDELPTRPAGEVTARLDGETLFANVRLGSGFVPARVVGGLEGRVPTHGTPVAIAVNGRVAAMTRTFMQDRGSHFAALVPETSFREGRNDVEVFLVDSAEGTLGLARIGGTVRGTRYALSTDERSLVLPTGERVPFSSGALAGRVESSIVEGSTVRIQGWAADVRHVARVDRILLFAGQRLIFTSDTPVYRWNIGGISGIRGLQRIGFVAELPVRDVGGPNLRAVALRGKVATELDWPGRALGMTSIASRAP